MAYREDNPEDHVGELDLQSPVGVVKVVAVDEVSWCAVEIAKRCDRTMVNDQVDEWSRQHAH